MAVSSPGGVHLTSLTRRKIAGRRWLYLHRLQRFAWVLLAISGLPLVIFGIGALLFGLAFSDTPVGLPGGPDAVASTAGVPWGQVVAEDETAVTLLRGVSRVAGLAFLALGVLVMAVASIPFRRGQRWAWFALWVVPGFMLGLVLHERNGDFVAMPVILLVLSIIALLLPSRSFFAAESG